MMDEMDEYDVIYLQMEELEETTWCADKINNTDIKYLLATPKREAADAMYEALNGIEKYANVSLTSLVDRQEAMGDLNDIIEMARAALALADGDGEE